MPREIPHPALPQAAAPASPSLADRGRADGADSAGPVRAVPTERWFGVYPAIVTDNRDPEGIGRVRVRLPWAPDAGGGGITKHGHHEAWARLATLSAGQNRGSWFLPERDDEVLVAFEAGHPAHPVVVGALWNGHDTPPATADAGNTVKLLRTRGGSELRFDDTSGAETVRVQTVAGQSIELTTGDGGSVRVSDGHGNAVTLRPSGVTVASSAPVRLQGSTITLDAASVIVRSAILKCEGVIQGTTLIAEQVVASSYTPGAGNVW